MLLLYSGIMPEVGASAQTSKLAQKLLVVD
jgi:hypothetical protein